MPTEVNPAISILFATRDRCRLLERTLASLVQLSLPKDLWEVIVVDNGSTDDTPAVLRRFEDQLPLRTLVEVRPGKNVALNRALEIARGRLFVFTDDDIVADSNWLTELLRASDEMPECDGFGGRIVAECPPETPSWLRNHPWAPAAFAQFEPDLPRAELPPTVLPFGPNYAVRARVLAGVRFLPSIGPQAGKTYPAHGETELLRRLRARNCRFAYVPSASVSHYVAPHQLDLGWLFRRAFCFGRGEVLLLPSISRIDCRQLQKRILLRLVGAWFANLRARFSSDERRFESGLRWNLLRGRLHQVRICARQPAIGSLWD